MAPSHIPSPPKFFAPMNLPRVVIPAPQPPVVAPAAVAALTARSAPISVPAAVTPTTPLPSATGDPDVTMTRLDLLAVTAPQEALTALIASPPTAVTLQHGPVAMPRTAVVAAPRPVPTRQRTQAIEIGAPPDAAVTRITTLPRQTPYELIRSVLAPTVAAPGTSILPPANLRVLVEPLRRITPHMLAAKITDGFQGTIQTPFGLGITSRAVKKYATNEDALGHAVLIPSNKGRAPIEVFILADGAGGHGHGDAASTAVVDEILAALVRYDGHADQDGEWHTIEALIEQGIPRAHTRIQAMPSDPQHADRKPCSTVQIMIAQTTPDGKRVEGKFLWSGDSVGFQIARSDTLLGKSWRGGYQFTTPHAAGLMNRDEVPEQEWLESATNVIYKAIGMGRTPTLSAQPLAIGITGGWYGATCDGILGDNYGIGDVRAGLRGTTFDDVAASGLALLQGLDDAARKDRKIRARLGTRDRLAEAHAHRVKPDNRSLWMVGVPTAAEQATLAQRAARLIDQRLLQPGSNASLTSHRHPTRVRMAAALLQDPSTEDLATLVLGQ